MITVTIDVLGRNPQQYICRCEKVEIPTSKVYREFPLTTHFHLFGGSPRPDSNPLSFHMKLHNEQISPELKYSRGYTFTGLREVAITQKCPEQCYINLVQLVDNDIQTVRILISSDDGPIWDE